MSPSPLSPLRSGLLSTGAAAAAVVVAVLTLLLVVTGRPPSAAAATPIDLGTAEGFGVLAGAGVTNTGPSVISADLGTSPNPAVTGFPPGTVLGTIHAADAVAGQAQADLTTAYDALAAQASDQQVSADLAGLTLTTGVYTATSSMGLTGALTLDAQGDPSATFIFQVGSSLTIASGSQVNLVNGAQACNVFWQVGSSATLGTDSHLRGSVLALTSITAATGADLEGRLLARNGSVTLDDNIITTSACAALPTDASDTDTTPTDSPTDSSTDTPTDSPTDSTDGPASTDTTSTTPTDASEAATSTPTDTGPTATASDAAPAGDSVLGAAAGAPDQVSPAPSGFPNTGEGGSVGGPRGTVLVGGGLAALLFAAALALRWRRETPRG